MPIDGHAGDRNRQPGADRRLAGDVVAGRALLQRGAEHDVLDLARIDAGAAHRLGNDVAGQHLRLGVVEGAAIGLADRGPRGRDDDGFAHVGLPRSDTRAKDARSGLHGQAERCRIPLPPDAVLM